MPCVVIWLCSGFKCPYCLLKQFIATVTMTIHWARENQSPQSISGVQSQCSPCSVVRTRGASRLPRLSWFSSVLHETILPHLFLITADHDNLLSRLWFSHPHFTERPVNIGTGEKSESPAEKGGRVVCVCWWETGRKGDRIWSMRDLRGEEGRVERRELSCLSKGVARDTFTSLIAQGWGEICVPYKIAFLSKKAVKLCSCSFK